MALVALVGVVALVAVVGGFVPGVVSWGALCCGWCGSSVCVGGVLVRGVWFGAVLKTTSPVPDRPRVQMIIENSSMSMIKPQINTLIPKKYEDKS